MQPSFYNSNQQQPTMNWNLPTSNYVQPIQNNTFATPPVQQTPQRTYIPGRIVNAAEEIKPNETPGDGSIAIFPFADRSKILIKEMTANGTIADSVYVLQPRESTQTQNVDVLTPILARLDEIEKMIKRRHRYKKPVDQNKQEGDKS